eukprot:3746689-Pyramimonas_sp.AAC.1
MWLSLKRYAHSLQTLQSFRGFQWSAYQKWCFGRVQDHAGVTVMLIRGAEVQTWRSGAILDR